MTARIKSDRPNQVLIQDPWAMRCRGRLLSVIANNGQLPDRKEPRRDIAVVQLVQDRVDDARPPRRSPVPEIASRHTADRYRQQIGIPGFGPSFRSVLLPLRVTGATAPPHEVQLLRVWV